MWTGELLIIVLLAVDSDYFLFRYECLTYFPLKIENMSAMQTLLICNCILVKSNTRKTQFLVIFTELNRRMKNKETVSSLPGFQLTFSIFRMERKYEKGIYYSWSKFSVIIVNSKTNMHSSYEYHCIQNKTIAMLLLSTLAAAVWTKFRTNVLLLSKKNIAYSWLRCPHLDTSVTIKGKQYKKLF